MKKILFIALAFTSLNINAQKTEETSNEIRAVKKGNIIIDGFYGFPNLFKSFFKAVVEDPSNTSPNSSSTVKVYGIGPVGGNFQYLIEDKFGLLLEANYMNFGFDWKDVINANTTYNYKLQFNIIRVMVGGEYHAAINEQVDLFGSAKIGLSLTNINYSDNNPDPNFTRNDFNFRGGNNGVGLSSRLCGGIRFFPIKPIGIFIEGGLFGGGIVRGGVSIKL